MLDVLIPKLKSTNTREHLECATLGRVADAATMLSTGSAQQIEVQKPSKQRLRVCVYIQGNFVRSLNKSFPVDNTIAGVCKTVRKKIQHESDTPLRFYVSEKRNLEPPRSSFDIDTEWSEIDNKDFESECLGDFDLKGKVDTVLVLFEQTEDKENKNSPSY